MKIVEHIEAASREIGEAEPNNFEHLCVVDCLLKDTGVSAQLVWKQFSGPGDHSARLFALQIEGRLWDLSGYTNWDDMLQKHLIAKNPLVANIKRWRGSTEPFEGSNPFASDQMRGFMRPRDFEYFDKVLAWYQQKLITLSTESALPSRPSSSPRL